MFFTTHLAPNIMIGPTIASGVILNPYILRKCLALKQYLQMYVSIVNILPVTLF